VGHPLDGAAGLAQACAAVRAQGAKDIIVTHGARGVSFTTPTGIAHLDAIGAHIVDVTGAGDAFAAAVCHTLAEGSGGLELACRRGLQLSAMTLACAETVCPALTPDSLDEDDALLAMSGEQPFNALFQD